MTLSKWLRRAAINDGDRPGVTAAESAENRELNALRCRIRVPARGGVLLLSAAPTTSDIRNILRELGGPTSDDLALPDGEDEVLDALVSAFATNRQPATRPETRPRATTTINNRRLVNACIDLSDEIGGIPSLSELCGAFSVSERRLRAAFYDSCGTGPNAFLRSRHLGLARRRLLAPDAPTVTAVANDLGFHHPGRFAGQYKRLFGELPHETPRAVDADQAPDVHIPVGHDEPAALHLA
jgi:AraC-like DNA-binding protein